MSVNLSRYWSYGYVHCYKKKETLARLLEWVRVCLVYIVSWMDDPDEHEGLDALGLGTHDTEVYRNERHQRAIVRLCALLWMTYQVHQQPYLPPEPLLQPHEPKKTQLPRQSRWQQQQLPLRLPLPSRQPIRLPLPSRSSLFNSNTLPQRSSSPRLPLPTSSSTTRLPSPPPNVDTSPLWIPMSSLHSRDRDLSPVWKPLPKKHAPQVIEFSQRDCSAAPFRKCCDLHLTGGCKTVTQPDDHHMLVLLGLVWIYLQSCEMILTHWGMSFFKSNSLIEERCYMKKKCQLYIFLSSWP